LDTTDWKSRYLAAIREMEDAEQRWLAVEKALRRLVGRLCAAATGIDERLDEQLSSIAAATRRDPDPVELKALADSLGDAVLALEKRSIGTPQAASPGGPREVPAAVAPATPIATPARGPAAAPAAGGPSPGRVAQAATVAAVAGLLEQLAALDSGAGIAAALNTQLAAARDDNTLARVLDQVADLVRDRSDALARDRREVAAMLSQVTERLGEMAEFLAGTTAGTVESRQAVDALNREVLEEVARMSTEAEAATDLAPLRALVANRLEAVATRVREFRAHQESRFVAHAARIERMRTRIIELEKETVELHRGLAAERRHARTDVLTGVANRAALDERLLEEIERRKRFPTPVALLVWDIDHFKKINDEYGHRSGDAVLREVARALGARKRATDHLARFGGEEFVMLLVGTALGEAQRVAESLREAVAAMKFGFRGTPVRVTVSCGITELTDADDPQSAFDRADAALYRAKESGRNCCRTG
jgi:diguanylate cyclase